MILATYNSAENKLTVEPELWFIYKKISTLEKKWLLFAKTTAL